MNAISALTWMTVAGWTRGVLLFFLLLFSYYFIVIASSCLRHSADHFLLVIFLNISSDFYFHVAFCKLLSFIFSGPSSWRCCSRQFGSDGEYGNLSSTHHCPVGHWWISVVLRLSSSLPEHLQILI